MRRREVFDSKLAAKSFAKRLHRQSVQVFSELRIGRFCAVDSERLYIDLMFRHRSFISERVLSGRPNRVPPASYGNHSQVLAGRFRRSL